MGTPGRKRKFKGYDPTESTQAKLNRLNTREAKKAKAHVLAQPHRRGLPNPEHPWAVSALGRLCLTEKLHEGLYEAGEEYRELVRRYQAAWGIGDGHHTEGCGTADEDGPSAETVAKWKAAITQIEHAWARIGVLATMGILLRDDLDLPSAAYPRAIAGLEELGIMLGTWQKAVNN